MWSDEKNTLLGIEKSLNQLNLVQASYVQKEDGEADQTGTLYWSRPNKLHLNIENKQHLIVRGGTAVFYDLKLSQRSYISIDDLPLSFLLQDHINLRKNDNYQFKVAQTEKAIFLQVLPMKSGLLPLYFMFNKGNLMLAGWAYLDDQTGYVIKTSLLSLTQPQKLDDELFKLKQKFAGFENR